MRPIVMREHPGKVSAGQVRFLAVLMVLAVACGERAQAPGTSPTDTPASTSSAPSSTGSATLAVIAAPSPRTVAFPDLPFIVGTNTGDLYFQLVNGQPVGRKVHACDAPITNLVALGRQALFLCYGTGPGIPTLHLYDDTAGTVVAIAKTEHQQYALTGTGQAVYVTQGQSVPTAPITMTKLMVIDLRTGTTTTIDERFGVAFEVRLTGDGVMVWRPQNSLSFRRSEAEAGSWILRGTTLTKLSLYRLIDGATGRDLLESEPVDPGTGYATSSFCCTYVVSKTTTEQRLTPPDVRNEKGLAVLQDGRFVTWRPENGEYDGSVVVYNGLRVERMGRGRFSSYGILRSGDWIVTREFAPTSGLNAYRISDGAFASMPGSGVSALAILGR
jgi:hypothetical protein